MLCNKRAPCEGDCAGPSLSVASGAAATRDAGGGGGDHPADTHVPLATTNAVTTADSAARSASRQ